MHIILLKYLVNNSEKKIVDSNDGPSEEVLLLKTAITFPIITNTRNNTNLSCKQVFVACH